MKTWHFIVLLGILLAAFFIGCGQSGTNSNSFSAVIPGACSGSGCNNAPPFTAGDTETFVPASMYALSQYAAYTVTNATNAVVNINLAQIPAGSTNVYLGQMSIQYNDQNGIQHTGTFVNGTSTQGYQSYPNTVSTLVGSTYRLFFEDYFGAIILTISKPAGTDTTTTTSGQIWFYNFNSAAQNPLYGPGQTDPLGNYYPSAYPFCWMVTLNGDPYNCRNFAVPPSVSYHDPASGEDVPAFGLLGNIPTINLHTAFGI